MTQLQARVKAKRVAVTVTIDASVLAQVCQVVDENPTLNRSEIVNQLLVIGLKHLTPAVSEDEKALYEAYRKDHPE